MRVRDGCEEGLDDDFASQGDVGVGATIMGRNMSEHIDRGLEGYECTELVSSPSVAHVRLAKAG
ncbi:MAG: hypothetical protein QOG39_147 [Acidimicrobiaceae bacterium]|jgi:hypothetical protein